MTRSRKTCQTVPACHLQVKHQPDHTTLTKHALPKTRGVYLHTEALPSRAGGDSSAPAEQQSSELHLCTATRAPCNVQHVCSGTLENMAAPMSRLSSLALVDLSDAGLQGTLPADLGVALSQLKELDMNTNQLRGTLPLRMQHTLVPFLSH